MPTRSFSSPTGGEPVTFDLDGQTYECIPMLPAGFGLDILRYGTAKAAEFFDVIMVPDSAERFAMAIRDPERPVPQETLDEVIRWLVEVYTGRPTGPSNGSSTGPPATVVPLTP
jgi:hypothetical protein